MNASAEARPRPLPTTRLLWPELRRPWPGMPPATRRLYRSILYQGVRAATVGRDYTLAELLLASGAVE